MGYEMIQHFENVNLNKKNNLNLPDSIFIRPSITLVFDNVNDKILITKLVCKNHLNSKQSFKKAKDEIEQTVEKINKPIIKKSFSSIQKKKKN